MFIGIDFGTCYSTVSIYVDNDTHTGVLNTKLCGERGEATMMRWDKSAHKFIMGRECERDYALYAEHVIKEIKTKIRAGAKNLSDALPAQAVKTLFSEKVVSNGHSASYEDLMSEFLGWLINSAVTYAFDTYGTDALCDEKIEGVKVTVPCGLSENGLTGAEYRNKVQRGVATAYKELIKNGIILGTGKDVQVDIVEEPVAAAVAYIRSRAGVNAVREKKALNILVVDIGGGTTDVTIVEYKKGDKEQFRVVDKAGDLYLGGNLWDQQLLDFVEHKISQNHPEVECKDDVQRRQNLERAKLLKETLSLRDAAAFIEWKSQCEVRVTKNEFENCSKKLLTRVKTLIKGVVDSYGGIGKIDKIVLVGGSCRMPQIKNGIKELFGGFDESNIALHNPSYAISDGAAFCAAMKDDLCVFSNIANANYGFKYDHITYSDQGTKQYTPYLKNLIFKGEPYINGKIERSTNEVYRDGKTVRETSFGWFSAIENDQDQFGIYVYESGGEARFDENGDIEWNGHERLFNANGLSLIVRIPEEYKNRACDYNVRIKLILDSNGIMTLEAKDEKGKVYSNKKQIL